MISTKNTVPEFSWPPPLCLTPAHIGLNLILPRKASLTLMFPSHVPSYLVTVLSLSHNFLQY